MKNLKRLRKERGLSQGELGERIGVKGPMISKYESGSATPPPEKLNKLCEVFGVKAAELYESDNDVSNENGAAEAVTTPKHASKEISHSQRQTSKKRRFGEFSSNAMHCENFDPGEYLVRKKGAWVGMLYKGSLCVGDFGPLYVPSMILNIDAYRAWLLAEYPLYSTRMSNPEVVERFGRKYLQLSVVIYRHDGDTTPFSAVGIAEFSGRYSYESVVNFAYADALKRAMKNQGFGLGLNWTSIHTELQAYVGESEEDNELPTIFKEYSGPIYADGEIIRDAAPDYDRDAEARMIYGKVDPLVGDDEETAESNVEMAKDAGITIPQEKVNILLDAINSHNKRVDEASISDPLGLYPGDKEELQAFEDSSDSKNYDEKF